MSNSDRDQSLTPKGIRKLVEVVAKLRSPDGCPWDIKQTHKSLVPYLLEEAWEVASEIEEEHLGAKLQEELGDLLLQVVLHSKIAEEEGRFDFDSVAETIAAKMTRRHPHVFKPDDQNLSEKELQQQWRRIKAEEKNSQSVMEGIPVHQPALMSALAIGKRAAALGFDWKHPKDVYLKIIEELDEVKVEIEANKIDLLEVEIGDLLFAVSSLARFYKINPEAALKKSNKKFVRRFKEVEKAIHAADKSQQPLSLDEMEEVWQQAKKNETGSNS